MNLIGHPYLAFKLFQPLSWYHIAGSYLPDIVPFVTTTTFSFEEIHEGGAKLYQYLAKSKPQARGLALGMLSHGITYGADKYSHLLEERYSRDRHEIVDLIMTTTPNITRNMADKARFHNFLWWGIDVCILQTQKDFIRQLKLFLDQVNLAEITQILSNCFNRDDKAIYQILSTMFEPLKRCRFESVSDLASLWQMAARGLPEKDEVNVSATVKAFEYLAKILEPDYKTILDTLVGDVRTNLEHTGFLP